MQSAEFLLCATLMAGLFVTKPATALDCPSGEFLDATTGVCEPCTACGGDLSTCQPQEGAVCGCPAGQYLVSPTSVLCDNCTACSPGARIVAPACADGDGRCVGLSSYGCLESLEFFNSSAGTCVPCTVCTTDQVATQLCSGTRDAVCSWRCPYPDFQFFKIDRCILNCNKCPGSGKCSPGNTDSCLCNPSCYDPTDKYCQHSLCTTTPPPTKAGSTSETSPHLQGPDLLPPWGIGLIAVSIVASMLLFSGCVLLVCYCSRNLGARDGKRPDSTSSESGLFAAELANSHVVVVKGRSETTPIPLLSIFQKMDDAQGNLLSANGHVFLSLDRSGIIKTTNLPRAETGFRTLSKGSTLGTAV
ncbi:hypothetical protein EMCRGX_G009474 [Ephydatia muelleri]|eukprot:Em0003g731a